MIKEKSKEYQEFIINVQNRDKDFRMLNNYSDYLIDIVNGRVWNKRLNRYLNVNPNRQTGYVSVGLTNDDPNDTSITRMSLHELIMSAYMNVHPKQWKQHGLEINHIDRNKGNNSISNLELVTRKQQYDSSVRKDMRKVNVGVLNLKDDDVREIREAHNVYEGKESTFIKHIGWMYQKHYMTIRKVIKGQTYKHVTIDQGNINKQGGKQIWLK